jgi:3' terminal RNA ribose 2'-O-methyltransferase Hen1
MLLTISTTHQPATDLGYLLHKHPERVQTFPLTFGLAHIFYPEATAERCTAALLLEVDPIGLARGRGRGSTRVLEHYVNDRPYVASSFLSVAVGEVFRSALSGRSRELPDLVETPLPLEASISVVPCRSGEPFLRRLFEPLGYRVTATTHPLDERFAEWGASRYFTVELAGTVRLSELLAHLTVLVPVLDDAKHYYVGTDEIDKLLRRGEGWLAGHPEREEITRRYLRRRGSLVRDALERLIAEERPDQTDDDTAATSEEEAVEARISLNQQRLDAVLAALTVSGASSVVDLGCGEGRLLRLLMAERQFTRIVGMDVSHRVLENAADRLRLERLPERQRERIRLIHGSLTYRDTRLGGFDAAAVVEVIEHLDPARLTAFERVLFEHARPGTVVVTTPNAEYNVRWASLPAGRFRHRDHRFEWTRAEFESWADGIATRYGYTVSFAPIGPVDPEVGSPTQMAIFVSQRREPEGHVSPTTAS